ncbi:50S ribosomal protein L4 [Gracilariopsis chorda]|uniref:Large ribosomal subunit protein uL4m n=1 Tax=Gracilariopsis chorda TaxID=448386 RepID=A0A2V3IZL8_9FLOR|nr:50S ribosomal protein L4 [Gracilariopsis chorda]|eukprot:PXF47539.1 50S ribosomal protein L4 [Gracilariopsis chorda]
MQTAARFVRALSLIPESRQLCIPFTRALSTTATQPSVPESVPSRTPQEPPLQPWSGADVQLVLHDSFENMMPKDVITLPGAIFNAPIRSDLVHRVITWQLAKRRQGTSKAKNRSEVNASGRKIRPQKGTGRSRQGAVSSPIFRGGGKAHGPVPRNYDFPLPHNVRRNALRSALTSKFQNDQLWIVDSALITHSKTSNIVAIMERLKWRSALVVDDQPNGKAGVHDSLYYASHNLRAALAMNALGLNVHDILSFDMLVLTRDAVQHLTNRYAKYDWLY